MTYQRPAKPYRSHSSVKLMAFEEALEKKRLDIAQGAPETVILAADEASLYLQASLMRVWSVKGQPPVVRVSAGQDNTHFYGALNWSDGQEVTLQSAKRTAKDSRGVGSVLDSASLYLSAGSDSSVVGPGHLAQRGGGSRGVGRASSVGGVVVSAGVSGVESTGAGLESGARLGEPQPSPGAFRHSGERV